MKAQKTYQGFIDFVEKEAKENPSRVTIHSQGWEDCAVGDYLDDDREMACDFANVTLNEANENLVEFLNSDARDEQHGTYESLWEAMQEYL